MILMSRMIDVTSQIKIPHTMMPTQTTTVLVPIATAPGASAGPLALWLGTTEGTDLSGVFHLRVIEFLYGKAVDTCADSSTSFAGAVVFDSARY